MILNNIIMCMGVDVALYSNSQTGEVIYDTVSDSILIYDGSVWRITKQEKIESKFERRKRIISQLLPKKS